MSKETEKTLLKDAREAIKNKQFKTALKLSKMILKDNENSYMGLVFLGLSLQEVGPPEQAVSAYRKAIKLNESNILAWNGLASHFSKCEGEKAQHELVEVYTKLLDLEKNEKKLVEICEKLQTLWARSKSTEILKALYKLAKSDIVKDVKNTAWLTYVNICSKIEVPDNFLNDYEEALSLVTSQSDLVTKQYYSEYLKQLYKSHKYERLFEEADKMYALYSIDLTPLEWICKVHNELAVESRSTKKERVAIEQCCDTLQRIQGDSESVLFTRAVLNFQDNKCLEAKEMIKQVTASRSGLLHAWVLQAQCNLRLSLYRDAAEAALKADKLLQSTDNKLLRKQVNIILAEALSRLVDPDHLKKAIGICSENLDSDERDTFINCLVRCRINAQNYSEAEQLIAEHEGILGSRGTLLKAQLLRKQGKLSGALSLLEENVELPEWNFEVGSLYWELQQYEKSLVPFLKAAKLDPDCYLYFLHLGHYYKKMNIQVKARRCYEKTYRMNADCIEAAIELSNIYRILKKWDANIALLENITESGLGAKNNWAWLQLGMNYLAQENYEKAIDTLRFVIRTQSKNSHCWESLADAYLARGAYTSALKSYQKAAELSSNALYPLLQVATIKQILGEYAEAISDFKGILAANKHYLLALKGIAETYLRQARQYRKSQLLGLARDAAQNALDMITIGIQQRNDLSSLWKLAADCCFLVAPLPDKYCCMLVLRELVEGIDDGNKILEEEELYEIAERCYYKALNIFQDQPFIWHDLSSCLLSHAERYPNVATQLLQKADSIAQYCAFANPTNWQHWNLMGVIAMKRGNSAVAQHAFVKAISADANTAVAWCNLGTLYLIKGDLKLANQAFSRAQRADPNYVNSWIGQALIAENLGAAEDAMDLFRHSTQLGFHREGAIGYGHWVCETLLNAPTNVTLYSIHNMHAIPIACDALTWYTENNNDPCSWNMLGLLRERMGLNKGAGQAFRSALRLCDSNKRDKVLINHARLLYKLGKYEQAIETYKDVREATFSSGSGLALALFKAKKYEESYESYEQALHWLTDTEAKQSDLLVALASMAYTFQGPDSAKTLLLQSTQLKPPSPYGLYALLSLGLLHQDTNLAKLVLKELANLRDDPHCVVHYSILLSYMHLLQGEYTTAVREISKLTHRHPNVALLWVTLSAVLLQFHKKQPQPTTVAAKCAQAAVKLDPSNASVPKVLSIVFLSLFLSENRTEALKAAQKAVHCYPHLAESWTALSAVVSTECSKIYRAKLIDHIVSLDPPEQLRQWLVNSRA